MYIVNKEREDGFGAQYQSIIFSILFSELQGFNFAYRPFKSMEHNYDLDPNFIEKKENLINIKNNYTCFSEISDTEIKEIDLRNIYEHVESNLDLCLSSNSFLNIKNLFYSNKSTNKTDEGKIVSLHIRRHNKFDIGDYGYTEDEYFLNVIKQIKKEHSDVKKIKIYSQGDEISFSNFLDYNVELHLNESVEETFINLVFSDILVLSKSSFSYCAGLLCNGTVYYLPFWHKPKSSWIKF